MIGTNPWSHSRISAESVYRTEGQGTRGDQRARGPGAGPSQFEICKSWRIWTNINFLHHEMYVFFPSVSISSEESPQICCDSLSDCHLTVKICTKSWTPTTWIKHIPPLILVSLLPYLYTTGKGNLFLQKSDMLGVILKITSAILDDSLPDHQICESQKIVKF